MVFYIIYSATSSKNAQFNIKTNNKIDKNILFNEQDTDTTIKYSSYDKFNKYSSNQDF